MTSDIHQQNKQLINQFRAALYDCDAATLKNQLCAIFAPNGVIHLTFPFGDLLGADALLDLVYQPLLAAIPDLERRDFIMMAGHANNDHWVGCAGYYMGVFEKPWLGIPPTRHVVAMRYHEFFRIEENRVVEMQAVWDIPQLMTQAKAWPLTPSLGVDWIAPAPATQDGIITSPYDQAKSDANLKLVVAMLTEMGKHPLSGGPEIMQLEKFWHPKMCWYGPSGIGSMRRIQGFRNWHQIPFLKALPDRRVYVSGKGVMFGDANYVAAAGWPNMQMTITGDGWLGIAPSNQKITMRSFDFWRCENSLIRENWVLIDLLHVYHQIGVDVFSRMRELTYARQ
jgi:predicted ester cyclase